jgi:hypothetical protein
MMLYLTSYFLIFLLGSPSRAAVMPVPVENAVQEVEVIPGRGLPSLASLNLTSADLFNPNFKPGSYLILCSLKCLRITRR